MPDFLSDEWFALVSSVDVGCDPELTFRLDQVLLGGPGGDARYRVTVEAGRLHASPGAGNGPADATLRLDYATAVDLATGRRSAHDAFLGGAVKFTGDLRRLQAATAALGHLGSALATVRDRTTYR